jgi:hypothetical protein
MSLLKQDVRKDFVRLDLDALAPAQMYFKEMVFLGGLRMEERKPAELGRQVSAKNTVKVVETPPRLSTSRTSVPIRSTALEMYDM